VFALPLGGGKLPGIAAEDIGRCAYGIFRRGPEVAGQRFGIAGEVLSGPEYAAAFSRHLGVPVSFYDMPFDDYRALGFPGADDMANMYEHHAIRGEEFRRHRSPEVARTLNPALESFDRWPDRECLTHPARLRRSEGEGRREKAQRPRVLSGASSAARSPSAYWIPASRCWSIWVFENTSGPCPRPL
jgi:hypothetical protein